MAIIKKKISSYRRLKSDKIIETIERLYLRINERFPNSSLSKVCLELLDLAKESQEKITWIKKPNYYLRGSSLILITIIVLFIAAILGLIFMQIMHMINIPIIKATEGDILQNLDALASIVIVLGMMGYYLMTIEDRIKRHRAQDSLRDLKAMAHVIDMHQLTKDPSKFVQGIIPTKSSPPMDMDALALIRYLDYCTEMLSLTGKIAALYGQNLRDTSTITTVNEIEDMTTGLSRKIWQKIMILNN